MSVDPAPGEKKGIKWLWLILLIVAFALIVVWVVNPAGEADPMAVADEVVPSEVSREDGLNTLEEYPVSDEPAEETAPEDFPQ